MTHPSMPSVEFSPNLLADRVVEVDVAVDAAAEVVEEVAAEAAVNFVDMYGSFL